jgi:hypothetical protein
MNTRSFPNMIFGAVMAFCLTLGTVACATDTVRVWYGNFDGSPIWAFPGYPTRVDVWIQTGIEDTVTGLHLCLGARDLYIDSMISPSTGDDCPFISWDSAAFVSRNDHSPPNLPGWSSQSFIGIADTGGLPNYAINARFPKRYLTFYLLPQNNQVYLWDTLLCMGKGFDSNHGPTWAYGPRGPLFVVENFSPLNFVPVPETCTYIIDTSRIWGTVTYLVRMFKGYAAPVPPELFCSHPALPGNHLLFALHDYNGDCRLSGADVEYLVGYFKGKACKLYNCPLTPYRIQYVR